MEVFAGTGGYSNEDWVGILYPEGTKPSDYLEIYSRYFNAVELNMTFYVIPGRKAIEGIVRKSATPEDYEAFFSVLEPMEEAGKLGVFLAQFPYRFHDTPENRVYLEGLARTFEGRRLTVEFRHWSWDREEVNGWLEDIGLFRVSTDYPPLRGLPRPALYVMGGFAYVRFHGRNREKWWHGKDQRERHDYRYSYEELALWLNAIRKERRKINELWLIFNNTTKGYALYNLCMLKRMWPDLPTRIDEILSC